MPCSAGSANRPLPQEVCDVTLTNLFQIDGKSLYAPDCDTGLRPNFQPVRARAHLPTPN